MACASTLKPAGGPPAQIKRQPSQASPIREPFIGLHQQHHRGTTSAGTVGRPNVERLNKVGEVLTGDRCAAYGLAGLPDVLCEAITGLSGLPSKCTLGVCRSVPDA